MSDQAANTAFNGAAPAEERTQALAELQKSHMPTQVDPEITSNVRRILDEAVIAFDQGEYEDGMVMKAINPNVVPFPSKNSKEKNAGMKSVFLDDWTINIQGDYFERPAGLSFDTLRTMVAQTPILNAVIMTRVRQVQRFCRVAENGNEMPGFEIRHIDRGHHLTKSEEESIALLNRFMLNNGWEFKPRLRKSLRRDSLAQFMAKSVRDSLTLDSTAIELEWKRDMSKGVDGFYAVDGATIRLCTEQGYKGDDQIHAIQLVDGMIRTAYTFDDLIYETRNPRTDVIAGGYGLSETELLIRIVTGYLNALTYNIKGFDSNAIPKGMLHLTGNYDSKDITAFKRLWNSMVKGVNNAWSLPVMVSKDQESKAAFEKFGVDFDEMYFAKWMTFLTSIICALYGMSPAEINFDSFSGGNTSPLAGSDTGEKLAASKDSGLRPLLAYYENTFSDFIVSEFSDKYVFRWTGLDPEDPKQKQEIRTAVLTVDEMRAEEGYKKHPMKEIGNAPLNPQLVSIYQQQIQPEPEPEKPPTAPDGTPLGPDGKPTNESGHSIGPDGEPLMPEGHKPKGSDFGEDAPPDFGKAISTTSVQTFGLPAVFDIKDM